MRLVNVSVFAIKPNLPFLPYTKHKVCFVMNIVLKLFRIRLKACSFTIMLMTLLKIMDTTTHSRMIVLILDYGSASKNLFSVFLMLQHKKFSELPNFRGSHKPTTTSFL